MLRPGIVGMRESAVFLHYMSTPAPPHPTPPPYPPRRAALAALDRLILQVYAEATLVLPLLVAQTFAKDFHAEATA